MGNQSHDIANEIITSILFISEPINRPLSIISFLIYSFPNNNSSPAYCPYRAGFKDFACAPLQIGLYFFQMLLTTWHAQSNDTANFC